MSLLSDGPSAVSLANAPKLSPAADMEMEDVHIAGRPGDTKTTLGGAPASSPTGGAGRGGERKMSLPVTYLTFFKSFVGLGVLALPGAFLEAGYVEESCVTHHHITPCIHPLYTVIAVYTSICTRYTCTGPPGGIPRSRVRRRFMC